MAEAEQVAEGLGEAMLRGSEEASKMFLMQLANSNIFQEQMLTQPKKQMKHKSRFP